MSDSPKATITIQNFGPIKDIMIDLSQTTLVTGAQATGKSIKVEALPCNRNALVPTKKMSVQIAIIKPVPTPGR